MPVTADPVSRHKCLIYEGHASESLPVVVPLLIQGLSEGRRCLYLGDPAMVQMTESALKERGVDVAAHAERGALIFSSDRSHLKDGFDPEAMVGMLVGLIDQAVKDGFTGLCATGDMRWELGGDENFERLQEYEAMLERVFRDKPLMGICQYHRDTVPSRAVREALTTHQAVYLGRLLDRDNLFYIPPELLLGQAGPGLNDDVSDWMCRQILRIAKAEEERDRALRDLERRVVERTADLEAANAELEAFSYSVSHDLKAPLRSIIGFSELVLEREGADFSEETRKDFGHVVGAAKRMGDLIDSLLELSKISRRELRREPVDLSREAEAAFADLKASYPERRVTAVVQPGLAARGDPHLLGDALRNLIGNSWKYTSKRPEARIEFGAEMQSGKRVFFVKDDGAGFDASQAARLFKPFQRLHSDRDFAGTGIGLATVKRILQRHQGNVWAVGAPGKGAAFYFSLPDEKTLE